MISSEAARGALFLSRAGAARELEERILATAYELFSHRGIRDVGINELIAGSHVTKSTFYAHFASKDLLVLAVLALRDRIWTDELLAEARCRGITAEDHLLAVFDIFGEWFQDESFESNTFVNVMLEMGPEHVLGQACIGYLDRIRGLIQALAEEAGLEDTDEFARSWHILMKGAIISATEGDLLASGRSRRMAGWLIDHHRS